MIANANANAAKSHVCAPSGMSVFRIAVARAAMETGVTVGEFTAAPVYPGEGRRPGLELAVECDAGLAGVVLERFGAAFDGTIKAQNVDYTTKRTDDVGMAPPTVTVLPTGTFHRWSCRSRRGF